MSKLPLKDPFMMFYSFRKGPVEGKVLSHWDSFVRLDYPCPPHLKTRYVGISFYEAEMVSEAPFECTTDSCEFVITSAGKCHQLVQNHVDMFNP